MSDPRCDGPSVTLGYPARPSMWSRVFSADGRRAEGARSGEGGRVDGQTEAWCGCELEAGPGKGRVLPQSPEGAWPC